jgi:hypothetical protein
MKRVVLELLSLHLNRQVVDTEEVVQFGAQFLQQHRR